MCAGVFSHRHLRIDRCRGIFFVELNSWWLPSCAIYSLDIVLAKRESLFTLINNQMSSTLNLLLFPQISVLSAALTYRHHPKFEFQFCILKPSREAPLDAAETVCVRCGIECDFNATAADSVSQRESCIGTT